MTGEPTPAAAEPRYEVVIVTYHSRGQLEGLLADVPAEVPVVVVDNASDADGVRELVEARSGGRYLDGKDIGFARAANYGASTSTAEHLVFCNPDSRPTVGVWDELVRCLEADPGLGAVGAATRGPDGQVEIGVGGWEPTLRRTLVQTLGLHKLRPEAGVYARPAVGDEPALEWISGACLAVPRRVFLEVGGFDERYFVYNEDMALGGRLRRHGYRQLLRTDLAVPHAAGSSGGGSLKMLQQRGASMGAYLRDHNPLVPAAAMTAVYGAGAAARVALYTAQRRPDRARLQVAYLKGLVTRRSPYTS